MLDTSEVPLHAASETEISQIHFAEQTNSTNDNFNNMRQAAAD